MDPIISIIQESLPPWLQERIASMDQSQLIFSLVILGVLVLQIFTQVVNKFDLPFTTLKMFGI
jgi:hypothetical protein